ncbi:MAG: hypothetical protein ACD_61C00021G0001 [uncultured bacterium]|nr:MAG: hypothetical protein ACD_61C00021G0001 [uncultured bacterium]
MPDPRAVPGGMVKKSPASSARIQSEISITSGEYNSSQSYLSGGLTENSLMTT